MSTAQPLLNQSIQAGLFEELVPVAGLAPVKEKTFEDKVQDAIAAIKQQVIDGRHLVVAWSGGKDSSVTLNLAFTALRELKADGIEIPTLHAIHSRTGIDNPVVELYNKGQIKSIEAYGEASGIPTRVWVASPNLSNDYLVSLLAGRTIMSVGGNSRCQQMMKAAPLTRIKRQVRAFIAQTTGVKPKDAELVSLIGTRFDESIARAAKMKERGENATEAVDAMDDGQLVLSPIADWNTFDIFTYIGWVRSEKIEAYNKFDELVDIYRDANGGDCMVNAYIAGKEQSRPPCSSRTGCSLLSA
ncbi:phosphoadenosine phosphosulfate reductase family protein [Pseudomonas sp. GD03696]|uniref:phosphoadenosine phosphosulfate reductase domain-containing protein n=1 Tax=Pseudomonas sp. GD03696 TaxID=2975368 RepID=UPI00244AB994|nr:phosphoadenosine phosphosulfate reductase family protein [Pseudomonas sp. GD03696]MDH1930472.1 phosphoadenosine phosphosulfate reductase family protein [Pseudomonas sp. GD03696]